MIGLGYLIHQKQKVQAHSLPQRANAWGKNETERVIDGHIYPWTYVREH